MRNVAFAVFTLFFLGIGASAQVPTAGNVFVGYSYYHTNLSNLGSPNFNGWETTLEGKVFPHVGIVADLGGHYGSQFVASPADTCAIGVVCGGRVSTHVYQALFGPRFSASLGRVRPFAEFEFGVGHINTQNFPSNTSFAMALGGGVDYRIIRPVAWRFQGDYVSTHFFSAQQNNVRLSTGIVFRF
jgi:hypothetical protein